MVSSSSSSSSSSKRTKTTVGVILLLLSISAYIVFQESQQLYEWLPSNNINTYYDGHGGHNGGVKKKFHHYEKKEQIIVPLFEGASSFLSILRNAHHQKRSKILNALNNTNNASTNNNNNTRGGVCHASTITNEEELKIYNRAIEIDWIGGDLLAVDVDDYVHDVDFVGGDGGGSSNYDGGGGSERRRKSRGRQLSSSSSGSCHFVGVQFPPTKDTLQHELQRRVYVSTFHTAGQCQSAFTWEEDKSRSCIGNNFGGTLGPKPKEECITNSVGAHRAREWLEQYSQTATQCLNLFIQYNPVGQMLFANNTSTGGGEGGDGGGGGGRGGTTLQALQTAAQEANAMLHDKNNIQLLIDGEIGSDGFFRQQDWERSWNAELFVKWARVTLLGMLENSSGGSGSGSGNGGKPSELLTSAINFMERTLAKACEIDASINETMWQWCTCVGQLVNPKKDNMTWKQKGLRLEASTMSDAPLSLMRSFPGSLIGVFPPAPTAVYARNAVVAMHVHTPGEAYFPGCTAWWNQISKSKQDLTWGFVIGGTQPGSIFSNWTMQVGASTGSLREDIIQTCSEDSVGNRCPFPVYDVVIQIFQSYVDAYFHWYIEIWPRIAPFLGSLLADDGPPLAIYVGCDIKPWHRQFIELMGFNTSKVTLLGKEGPVFAREAVVPTSGYSHSPILNYWNLISIRRHVENRIGAAGPISTGKRKILIVVRDTGRRTDTPLFYDAFFRRVQDGLNATHYIETFNAINTTLMSSVEYQVRAFQSADVVIGSHGAGLSHLLFAKEGAIILERLQSNGDSAIYAELAFLMGMKYFPMGRFAPAESYVDVIKYAESIN